MNTREITNIYAGSTQGSRMYLGGELVWPIGYTPDTGDTGYTPVTTITINVPGTITDSGVAIAVVNPGDAEANIVFTSSDDTIATIDSQGNITAVSDGQVTICVRDTLTGLQDCQVVNIVKTPEPGPDTGDTGTTVITAIYDINTTGTATPLLNPVVESCVKKVELEDGTIVPLSEPVETGGDYAGAEYTFNETGLHTVFITIEGDTIYGVFQGIKRLKNITIPNTITTIGDFAFAMDNRTYPGSEASVLETVSLPSSITSIGYRAFAKCASLTGITIPTSVTSIGIGAFEDCTSLTSFVIPNSVVSVGDYIFSGSTSLNSVVLSSSVSYISNGMFYGCTSLQSFTIPSHITRVGNHAFAETGLQSINIPDTVLELGDNQGTIGEIGGVFQDCSSLASVSIGTGLTVIPPNTFLSCTALENVVIPNNITIINFQAFRECTALQTITIGINVWGIGTKCFYGCTSLQSIVFPGAVTWIGRDCMVNCTGLTEIVLYSTTPPRTDNLGTITNWLFGDGSCPIYVPDSAVSAYQTAYPDYASSITGISNRPNS